MKPIIIYPDRNKASVHKVGAFFIVPVLLWAAYQTSHKMSDLPIMFIMLFGAVGYSVLVVKFTKRIETNQPLLIIDKDGINDNASFYPVGPIPWVDIRRLSISTALNNSSILHLHLNESEKYTKLMQEKYKNARIKKTHPKTFTIKISEQLLPMTAEDLMSTIQEARKSFEQPNV